MSQERSASPPGEKNRRRMRAIAEVAAAVAAITLVAGVLVSCSPVAPSPSETEGEGIPDVVALAGPLAEQTVVWEACEFNEDGPPIPGADVSNVECATIQVPRDWLNPDPDSTWDVRISHAKNIESTDPEYHTTIIAHPGGPYSSGLSYSTAVQLYTPELRATTNYVSFDQRGLGQSSHASCDYEYDPAG